MEPLLLLCCRAGELMVASRPNEVFMSWVGELTPAGDSGTDTLLNLGVKFSWEMKAGSIVGKVWLRGREKLLLGGGNLDCCCIQELVELPSGENAKGVMGLEGPPEKDEGAVSVITLDNDVVL